MKITGRRDGYGWVPVVMKDGANADGDKGTGPGPWITAADLAAAGQRAGQRPASQNAPLPWLHGIDFGRPDENAARGADAARQDIAVRQRLEAYAKFINKYQELNSVIELMLSEARDWTRADGGTFYLVEKRGRLTFAFFQNDTMSSGSGEGTDIFKGAEIPIDRKSICGYAAYSKLILNIPDVSLIPSVEPYRFNSSFDESSGYTTVSIIAVPMLGIDNSVMAVLQLINKLSRDGTPIAFDARDENYARLLASKSMPYLVDALDRVRDRSARVRTAVSQSRGQSGYTA